MTYFRLLLALIAFFALAATQAQELSEEELLEQLQASAESLQDASFVLTGRLYDAGGGAIELEIEVQTIPGEELVRAYFIQPDALADNFVIVDGRAVYNYLFLTNQVTILPIDDPDALGGLFPDVQADIEEQAAEFDFSLNLERLFQGWTMTIERYGETPLGNAYFLRFDNEEEGANIGYVLAQVLDEVWVPYRLDFILADGTPLAELVIEAFVRDQGLAASELRFIPPDAEVIDER
jgi:outer membrane lipoprotein-sorting protein